MNPLKKFKAIGGEAAATHFGIVSESAAYPGALTDGMEVKANDGIYRLVFSDAAGEEYAGYAVCVRRKRPHVHDWGIRWTLKDGVLARCRGCDEELDIFEVNRRLNASELTA